METRILRILRKGPLSKAQISEHLDQKRVSGQLNKTIRLLLSRGAIAYTIPGKPNSRLQRYRIPGIQPVE
ncbi:MAG: ATP-dependent DNA helicase [Elusimicrobia bacterium CG_4_10_14_0_2_um_filter_63_34]|nr:MAG: ATP-dependent DNA helicase [Elusimicrobia bacterium CG_4_10_14_0_2_um_filter_63_34]